MPIMPRIVQKGKTRKTRHNIWRSTWLVALLRAVRVLLVATSLGPSLLPFSPSYATALGQQTADVLSDRQTEELREAADMPAEKLKLYAGYIDEVTMEMHEVNAFAAAQRRSMELHRLFAKFTAISDELAENLDSYHEQHEDLRKALKLITDKNEKWAQSLNEPGPDSAYDFGRKEALASLDDLNASAKQALAAETLVFAHKLDKKSKSQEAVETTPKE